MDTLKKRKELSGVDTLIQLFKNQWLFSPINSRLHQLNSCLWNVNCDIDQGCLPTHDNVASFANISLSFLAQLCSLGDQIDCSVPVKLIFNGQYIFNSVILDPLRHTIDLDLTVLSESFSIAHLLKQWSILVPKAMACQQYGSLQYNATSIAALLKNHYGVLSFTNGTYKESVLLAFHFLTCLQTLGEESINKMLRGHSIQLIDGPSRITFNEATDTLSISFNAISWDSDA